VVGEGEVIVLALDPGTTETGMVAYEHGRVAASSVTENGAMLNWLRSQSCGAQVLAIEWIESFGMPVGREVFETVRWIGRFQQAWRDPDSVLFIPRREVKVELCGSARAKDANVRQALLDRLGPQGTKKAPGPTYGVKSHAWSALAVAVVASARLAA
jgi:hypothetical protein